MTQFALFTLEKVNCHTWGSLERMDSMHILHGVIMIILLVYDSISNAKIWCIFDTT